MSCRRDHSTARFRTPLLLAILLAGTLLFLGYSLGPAHAASGKWEDSDLIQPEELVALLSAPNEERPLVVCVGFDYLFSDAHIPDALYIGPASKVSGVERLKTWAKDIRKNRQIILYCGCCFWRQCPNVRPAFEAVREAGRRNVKVLYLKDSFIQNWVEKGCPVAKGN